MRRLFIAIELPDTIKKKLQDLENTLGATFEGTYVKPEKLHITLLFLGNPKMIDTELEDVVKTTVIDREIELHGLDAFPNVKRPIVVFVPVTTPLDDVIESLCKRIGMEIPRDAMAHVTLLRAHEKLNGFEKFIKTQEDWTVKFHATNISLLSSNLKTYTRLA